MTAQIPETLRYEGRSYDMCTEPLSDYFEQEGMVPEFDSLCSSLWRGYIGTWEIDDGKLYLVKVSGFIVDDPNVTLARFFPRSQGRVFADWYSGTLRLRDGDLVEYVHIGYASKYERELSIEVEKGLVRSNAQPMKAEGLIKDLKEGM